MTTEQKLKNNLIILIGASGSGKTTIAKTIALHHPEITCLFFDSIGIPSSQEIVTQYGSEENFQREKTKEWIKRIRVENNFGKSPILFEGQMRLSFVQEALEKSEIKNVKIVLVDCNDEVRTKRLKDERNQPDLVNSRMMHWAAYLRQEAKTMRVFILDTSNQSLLESAKAVIAQFYTPL